MALRDNAIVAYAEAKHELRSGRDILDYAGEILDALLARAGLERHEVDGIIITPSATGATTPMWVQSTLDYLGLETDLPMQRILAAARLPAGSRAPQPRSTPAIARRSS